MGPELGHFLDSLGWAIVHSFWQGALAAAAVVIFRNMTKDSQASLRYGFQTLCLLATLATFVTTLILYQLNTPSNISATFQVGTTFEPIAALFTTSPAAPSPVQGQTLAGFMAPYTPLLGVLWCFGVALLALRYSGAFILTQRLRRVGLSDAPSVWQSRFQTLVLNAGLRRTVNIYISNRVSGPLTLGFFKPVVLVPASFFTGLTSAQVEAILLHEIAHIRRHDYLINLLQTAVKSIFFFHPAVHYICRRIDQDREHACDDFAVALTRDPQALARGLAALRLDLTPKTFALAADNGNTPLVARLKRLGNVSDNRRRPEHVLTSVMTMIIAAGFYVAASPIADAHQTPTPKPSPNPTPKVNGSHPSGKLGNYRFETTRMNGRTFTVKVAEDDTRWINIKGAWHDIDKNPEMIAKLPKTPTPPTPPTGKTGAILGNHAQSYGQYKVDLDYYIAQLEMAGNHSSIPGLAAPSPLNARKVHHKRVKAERTRDQIERMVEKAIEEGRREKEEAWNQAKSKQTLKPGLYIDGEHMSAPEASSLTKSFSKEMAHIEKQVMKGHMSEDQADDARDRAEERFEANIERFQEKQERIAEQQRERALERAEDERERAEDQRERAMEAAENALEDANRRKALNEGLLQQLKSDKLISRTAQTVTITYPGNKMTVNGKTVPHHLEDNYCEFMSNLGFQKSKLNHKTTIHISPNEVTFQSASRTKDKAVKPYKKDASASAFIYPTSTGWVSQGYNRKGTHKKAHGGIDLASPMKTPIKASAPGIVTYAKSKGKWGNMIKITHDDGYETHYAHVGEICVDEGKTVKQGDHIGSVGSTSASTGPHLHFEIRQNGQSLNPADIIADT